MPQVRVLHDGLLVGQRIHSRGEIVDDPHPRLLALAQPDVLHLGMRVAEIVAVESGPRPPKRSK